MDTTTNVQEAIISFVKYYWKHNNGIVNLLDVLEKYNSVTDVKYIFEAGKSQIYSLVYKSDIKRPDYLLEIIPFLKNIEEIDIRLLHVDRNTIELLARSCSRLKKITLQLPHYILCFAIGKIHQYNKDLRSFHLRYHHCQESVYNIPGLCLQVLYFTHINELILNSCKIQATELMPSLLHLRSLRILKMTRCSEVPSNFAMCIINVCHWLQVFHYHFTYYFPKDPYKLKECLESTTSSLTKFISRFNSFLNDEFLQYISERCSNLNELSIGEMKISNTGTDVGTIYFTAEGIKHVASLKFLHFLEIYGIRNNNLAEILRPLVKTLKGLTLLRDLEDFSDVAKMFLNEAIYLEKLVVLGHAVCNIEQIIERRMKENPNYIKLFLEEGSIEKEDVDELIELNADIVLITCKEYSNTTEMRQSMMLL